MRKFTTLLAIMLVVFAYAQKGDFLLTHHDLSYSNLDNSNFQIINDNNGLICLANRAGVLKYDGDSWDYYETPSAALSIDVDDNNVLYVGSLGSIGKIDLEDNKVSFQSLMETDTIQDLFLETLYFKNRVYFLGSHHLLIYDIEKDEIHHEQGDFINLYLLEDQLYLNTSNKTFQLNGNELMEYQTKIQIASAHSYSSKPPLLVDFDGELFVWDERAKRITHNKLIQDNSYEVLEAKWINDSLIACATFSDGVIFLNYNNDDFIEVADYHTGLPDNEILALHTDGSGGVWVAHPFGLTSVSPLFPAFSYSNFPGLKGNLTGIFQRENKLWVTSSLGLFHFDRDTTFKNQVYYTKVQRRKPRTSTQVKSSTNSNSQGKNRPLKGLFKKKKRALATDNSKKKGFFKSLAQGVEDLFDNSDNVERVSGRQAKSGKYVRRVRKVPVKINYHFSQLEGSDGKFFDLISYKDKLLLVGNSGIYEVNPTGVELILSENVRFAMVTSSDQLVVSTSDFQLKSFRLLDNIWIEEASADLEDIIVNIQEDNKGAIWMAGSSSLYSVSLSDTTISLNKTYSLNNQFLDDVDILERNDTVYFINSQGYFFYDQQQDQISENESMKQEIGLASTSISDPGGYGVWVFNGKNWYMIPSEGEVQLFEYLRLFKNLISIAKDEKSNQYWLLTKDNQLLKYDSKKSKQLASHDFFIKKLSNQKGDIDKSKKFSLSYDENFLTVELSKPDYLGLLNPEFQYKLEGLHTEWSAWTKSKSIDFSYLPAGQYDLLVRSKDAFGRMEEANMLSFSVRSPYWQQPWFYALQIILFGSLVVVSSRLNQSKSQNRLISGGLTVLTLILIIEFIQSAVGAFLNIQSTPVVDFLIDVFVALLIFPLEKFLREFLFKGKVDVKIKEKVIPKKKKVSAEKTT